MDVVHNEQERRFEISIDGHTAVAEYALEDPNRIVFTHTEVPDELSGRGIGGELAQRALDYAREKKLQVVPQCAFIASYIKRHPEYEDLAGDR